MPDITPESYEHRLGMRSVAVRRSVAALTGVLACLLIAAIVYGSLRSGESYLVKEHEEMPWHQVSSNQRVIDHQEAARFLTQLNFYENGEGLVLPPSITMSRIQSAFGVERFASLAGLTLSDGKLYGITPERLGNQELLVSGCAACHIGKAAGIVVPGLGNKTADLFGLVKTTQDDMNAMIDYEVEKKRDDAGWQAAHRAGMQAFGSLGRHTEYDSGTAGSANLFFVVAMAFERAGLPPLDQPLYAPVKTPSLWGYGPKRELGVFSDGLLKGSPAGAAGLPLFIGNYSLETFEKNMETYEAAEVQFEKLLPPDYPFEVKVSMAATGKRVFQANCAQCHGTYQRDSDGLPVFEKPMLVGIDEVGTDPLRATVYDQAARERFAASPFASHLQEAGHEKGYVAPSLWGIWARFPYLHNGSVANIADLLLPPEDRPRYIDLREIGERKRFDAKRLGATPSLQQEAARRSRLKDRWVFDATRKGLGNQGHAYGTQLSAAEKRALIEFLKTL